MNPGSEVITVQLRKETPDQPLGFRLQGGADFTTPLSIQSVNPGSCADRCGLRSGDAVLSINDRASDELEHDEAKRIIQLAGGNLTMVVQRGAVTVWKPSVTPLSQLRPSEIKPVNNFSGHSPVSTHGSTPTNADTGDDHFIQRTSLAANKQEVKAIGTGYNRTARPFTGFGGGSSSSPAPPPPSSSSQPPLQYSSYSSPAPPPPPASLGGAHQFASHHLQQQSSEDQFNAQSSFSSPPPAPPQQQHGGGYMPNMAGESHFSSPASVQNDAPPAHMPSGIRSVRAPITKAPSEKPQSQYMTCKECGTLIVGVFVKISGVPMHPECYKCVACGKNLKNQGYFRVNEKLYCDVCARKAAQEQAGGDMSAVPIYR